MTVQHTAHAWLDKILNISYVCIVIVIDMCSHVAALLFKLEAICRSVILNLQEHCCLASGTRASRQQYNFIVCEEIYYLHMILFQVANSSRVN